MSKAFKIRQATGNDLPFLYDTWLNSFRYDSPLGKSCKNSVFFSEYKLVVDRILSESETLVAHSPEDSDLIFAYLVFQVPDIIHYAFCKEAFRMLGIVHELYLEAFGPTPRKIDVTHKTTKIAEIFRVNQNLIHNPFHLYLKGAI